MVRRKTKKKGGGARVSLAGKAIAAEAPCNHGGGEGFLGGEEVLAGGACSSRGKEKDDGGEEEGFLREEE